MTAHTARIVLAGILLGWLVLATVWHLFGPACGVAEQRIADTQDCLMHWGCRLTLDELVQYREDLVWVSNHCRRT